ncbi:acetyl-CoA acetyltransferase [Deltaproteobacteria bacterium]|nr:acetyl-CoA acetyltransferase [Deltaproteobacteria bacterium]
MDHPVVCTPLRTPIGRFLGGLSEVRADDLAALVLRAVVERAGIDPTLIDEVALGCANQAGEDNRNVARMATLLAGLPQATPAYTVNRLCASGLEAVNQAARAVRLGDASLMLAGGVESMSRAPYVFPRGNVAPKFGNLTGFDTSLGWRFPNPKLEALFPLEAMGETAENVVERFGISREDQDAFAAESHRRAFSADFSAEILPVSRAKDPPVARDEGPRGDTTVETLAKLKPAFRKGGSVTAGNSSTLNDGAAAMIVTNAKTAANLGLKPMGRVLGCASAGVDPRVMGIGPVPAVQKLLARAGLTVADIGLWELNEAFAAQSLAVVRELGLSPDRVNVKGGAIALGHPLGMSGARIVATLLHTMRERNVRYGVATLCVGVGQGVATLFESVEA